MLERFSFSDRLCRLSPFEFEREGVVEDVWVTPLFGRVAKRIVEILGLHSMGSVMDDIMVVFNVKRGGPSRSGSG